MELNDEDSSLNRRNGNLIIRILGVHHDKRTLPVYVHETLTAEAKFLNTPTDALLEQGGRQVVLPIEPQGPIGNPAAPDYVSRVPGNFITVTQFPTEQSARRDAAAAPEAKSTQVLAKIFKPMPVMPDMPVIGSIEHREAPGFILLNGISMNSNALIDLVKAADENP